MNKISTAVSQVAELIKPLLKNEYYVEVTHPEAHTLTLTVFSSARGIQIFTWSTTTHGLDNPETLIEAFRRLVPQIKSAIKLYECSTELVELFQREFSTDTV